MKKPEAQKLSLEDFFGKAAFDIEHALSMYALSFSTIPAEAIYDKDVLAPLMSVIEKCHIYLIGFLPLVEYIGVEQEANILEITYQVLEKRHVISLPLPKDVLLKREGEDHYLQDATGEKFWPSDEFLQSQLRSLAADLNLEIKYIGQAYGQDGSRNAIDRLLKHETLQKISLKGVPKGYRLTLFLIAVQPSTQVFTLINPFAKNQDDGTARIKSGIDKLFNTTEAERISLYEAALIRYFSPEFNKEFKESFPSTNLKILQDCYKKDFSAVIAEISFDELPFRLGSSSVEPALSHIAKFNLHKDQDRRIFFGL